MRFRPLTKTNLRLAIGTTLAVVLGSGVASAVTYTPGAELTAQAAANQRPNSGTNPEAGPPFAKKNGVWEVNTTGPTLRNTVTDPDGDKSNLTFEVWTTDAAGKPKSRVKLTDDNQYGVLVSDFVASGKAAQVTVPAGRLTNGVTYAFHTSAYDGKLYETDWSPWTTFKVSVPAPAKPAKPTSLANNGKPGEFTVALPSGHTAKWVEWQLDAAAWKRVDAAGKTSVTIDTGLRAAAPTAPAAPAANNHTLNVRTANDDGASDAVSVAFTGNGTGNGDGDHAVDLTLPDPVSTAPNPDQTKQVVTGKITRPLGAPASSSPRFAAPAAKEQCGPVDKDGGQACFGAPVKFEDLPAEVQAKAKEQAKAKQQRPQAPAAGSPGMTDWCATNTSGAFATRTVECETKQLPVVYRVDGEPIATAYFTMTREISLDNSGKSFIHRLNIHPILIAPTFRAIEMVMANRTCVGSTAAQCKDPGKAELSDWDGKAIWQSPTDTHDANLTTTYTWDNSTSGAEYDLRTDFMIKGILIAGNTPGPTLMTDFRWAMSDPSDLEEIRCDTKGTGATVSGCVFKNVAPSYTFNAAKFPQAAAHAWLLQEKLPNTMGVKTRDTPLYYLPGGKRADGKNNRDVICDVASWASTYGDASAMDGAGDKPNCDEFAFNATYNSGGMPKAEGGLNEVSSGSQCVQTFTKKASDGAVHLYNIDGQAPTWREVCGRSAISGKHNSGSMGGFSGFAKNMRLMDKDPYWLETGMSGQCTTDAKSFKCSLRAN
ncbi:hypothetical protein [Streptomyces violascens]|uniref:hypothetical protein n=1 Tax=Streptomyces violascens TaxID=67381 RepID=UPI00167A6D7F|nr:hypothetical protein [Streptomyces violascens]